ncbi:Hypothetical predicted protein [Cloeon dipterum]|uniref:Uncharacterized protein n=1 Tax=Cloeon dipterum TaxID=197152 RepID=A0A8S1E6Y5_9INSE|nr:Hypothetical predicted protein [Cloeon dipterum]
MSVNAVKFESCSTVPAKIPQITDLCSRLAYVCYKYPTRASCICLGSRFRRCQLACTFGLGKSACAVMVWIPASSLDNYNELIRQFLAQSLRTAI